VRHTDEAKAKMREAQRRQFSRPGVRERAAERTCKQIILEAHGRFWHADPRFYDHDSLSPIQKRNKENDARKAEIAKKHGYGLKIIWEDDAWGDVDRKRGALGGDQ
jgi:hypothetical protein